MRVFIGVQLPPSLQKKVIGWQKKYQQIYKPLGMRWITEENLHVTIVPPWYIENVHESLAVLTSQPLGRAFTMTFENICFIPTDKPKFIWAFGQAPEILLQLRRNISAVLQRPLEKRKYALHATIARMQKEAMFEPLSESIQWSIDIHHIALFQSHHSSKGVEYEVVNEFLLE